MERKLITPEDMEEIIARIAYAKASVATACEGVCEPATFWRHLAEQSPDGNALRDKYSHAREARADARFESIDGVMGALLKGTIDHATARVMVDTIKWQCGREKPKRYGVEYRAVELSGPEGGPIETRNADTSKQALEDRISGIAERIRTGDVTR
jgi:hypothetical protein